MGSIESNKYRNKIFNLVVLVLATVIALSIYKKQVRDIDLLKDTRDVEKKKNIVLDDIGKLEEKIDSYKELLVNKEIEVIIGNISNMAKESGVNLISIQPEAKQEHSDYVKLPFSLVVNSFDYHSLGDFISRIESHPDVYIIDDIRINPLSAAEGLTVNLKLSSIEFAE